MGWKRILGREDKMDLYFDRVATKIFIGLEKGYNRNASLSRGRIFLEILPSA